MCFAAFAVEHLDQIEPACDRRRFRRVIIVFGRRASRERGVAMIKVAAEKATWETWPSPRRYQTGDKVRSRHRRDGTTVACRFSVMA